MPTYGVDDQVRRIACTLFAEETFKGVSLRRLAAALGMQAGSLYHYMDSKQALLFELIEEYEDDLFSALRSSVGTEVEPGAAVMTFAETFLAFGRRYPQEMQLARLERRCLNPQQRNVVDTLRRAQWDLLRRLVKKGIEGRRFAIDDAATAAWGVISILEGASDWPLSSATEQPYCGQYKVLVRNLLGYRALGAQ